MPYQTLAKRVDEGFDDHALDSFGVEYLKLLVERTSEFARAARRTGTLIVVLAVAFVLLLGARNAEIGVGPLKVTNVASVLPLLPVVLSFLVYELVVLVLGQMTFEDAVGAVVRRMYRDLHDHELDLLLTPATAALWGRERWRHLRPTAPGRMARAVRTFDRLLIAGLVGGSIAFMGVAVSRLEDHPHVNDALVSVAGLIVVANVVRTLLVILDEY